jgi:hypothetical protein
MAFLHHRTEGGSQLLDRPEDCVSRSAGPNSQNAADLGAGMSFEMPQQERRSLGGAQGLENPLHGLPNLAAFRHSIGMRISIHHRLELSSILEGLALGPASFLSHQIHGAIDGNAVQPGTELRSAVEKVKLAIGPEKGLLDHVFGILFTACKAEGRAEDPLTVTFDKSPEGVGVTVARLLHEFKVISLHSSH